MNFGKIKTLYPPWSKKLQKLLWVLKFQVKTWLLTISLLKSVQHCQQIWR